MSQVLGRCESHSQRMARARRWERDETQGVLAGSAKRVVDHWYRGDPRPGRRIARHPSSDTAICQLGHLVHQYANGGRHVGAGRRSIATRRITSYVGLLDSDLTAQAVIDATGVPLTASQVKARVSGESDLNTVLLTANVIDSDPERSFQIAQGLAENFGTIVNQVDPIGPDRVDLRVISGPNLNPDPVSPRMSVNLVVGLGIGLLVGVIVALVRFLLDNTIRQAATLRNLTGAPVLGLVPFDRGAKKSPLIAPDQARSVRAEAFRKIRTDLQFVDAARPAHVLVLTSALAVEGKSSTSVNLALSFADSGRRTLLVEGDLRRPRVADLLGMERAVGLTTCWPGRCGSMTSSRTGAEVGWPFCRVARSRPTRPSCWAASP